MFTWGYSINEGRSWGSEEGTRPRSPSPYLPRILGGAPRAGTITQPISRKGNATSERRNDSLRGHRAGQQRGQGGSRGVRPARRFSQPSPGAVSNTLRSAGALAREHQPPFDYWSQSECFPFMLLPLMCFCPNHSQRASDRALVRQAPRHPRPAGARPPAVPTARRPVPHLHAVLLFCACVDAVIRLASVPEAEVIGRAVGPFKLAFLGRGGVRRRGASQGEGRRSGT